MIPEERWKYNKSWLLSNIYRLIPDIQMEGD